ncbi:KaiA family protein [Thalassoporum mexicanum PCC 7367]|uniref:circadian clock protein KaiA n=1 Tax=Thalassoporum mexicanum TaxID=3457544 RepID=UPI00029F9BA7|nr:circadian clock protein KaiA [Pseudanabaena sp. PCC 7367]AFY68999.1 KaiA family protein [Pseudanabaena sp. PCC 7367]
MSSPILQICCLAAAQPDSNSAPQEPQFVSLIRQNLPPERYCVSAVATPIDLQARMTTQEGIQDCLVIWGEAESLRQELFSLSVLLPTVTINEHGEDQTQPDLINTVNVSPKSLEQLPQAIDQAISLFLELSPPANCALPETKSNVAIGQKIPTEPDRSPDPGNLISLAAQQGRLSAKLKERLGYLGVYYKRNSKQFWRHLSDSEKTKCRDRLDQIYRTIVLEYFKESPSSINNKIDEFVNAAFFADLSVSQVLEIHMNLMDEFSHKLQVEGRSEEILLDYRITLIDIIAHLCEMYRRSIPRDT